MRREKRRKERYEYRNYGEKTEILDLMILGYELFSRKYMRILPGFDVK